MEAVSAPWKRSRCRGSSVDVMTFIYQPDSCLVCIINAITADLVNPPATIEFDNVSFKYVIDVIMDNYTAC